MTEKQLVTDNEKIEYEGIFNWEKLYNFITEKLNDKDYQKHRKKYEENVEESGKNIFIDLRATKKKTSNATLVIKLILEFQNLTDTTAEEAGIPAKVKKGKVRITIDSWVNTDYEDLWRNNAYSYLFQGLIKKYFPMLEDYLLSEEGYSGEVGSDSEYLVEEVRSYLKLYERNVKEEEN